jgi:hypothetical protein
MAEPCLDQRPECAERDLPGRLEAPCGAPTSLAALTQMKEIEGGFVEVDGRWLIGSNKPFVPPIPPA